VETVQELDKTAALRVVDWQGLERELGQRLGAGAPPRGQLEILRIV
jgi:hypothetical protein